MKLDTLFLIMVFLVLVLMGTTSLGYSQKARFFPGIFIIASLILLVIEFLRGFSTRRKKSKGKAESALTLDGAPKSKVGKSRYLSGAAWIIGFLVALYLLGHLVSAFLLVLLYTRLHGERWLLAITLSLATVAVVYVAFVVGLERPLYKGLVFTLF